MEQPWERGRPALDEGGTPSFPSMFPARQRSGARCENSQRGLLLAVALLAACGGDSGEQAQDEKLVVVIGAAGAIDTPWHEGWRRFERRVNSAAYPGLELQMFVNGQLGTEETILANARRGRVQYAGTSLHGMSSVVPELSVILAPYLFESYEEVDFVTDRFLTPVFTEMLAERGLTFIQWSEVGWNHVYCREPKLKPEEFRGVKMRASTAIAPQVFTETIGRGQHSPGLRRNPAGPAKWLGKCWRPLPGRLAVAVESPSVD